MNTAVAKTRILRDDDFDFTIADVRFMLAAGEWPPRIATRLGMSTSTLARALLRHDEKELAAPFSAAALEERRQHRWR